MNILVRFPRPGPWIRTVVVILVILVISRWSPAIGVPLGLGGWLGWSAVTQPGPATLSRGS
jgi:hypothetical protein